jgi:hypothetical protein
MNRGETWQSFVTPLAPSLGGNTLAFHAKKWDWVLFTGQVCEDKGGWTGRVCYDQVRRLFPLVISHLSLSSRGEDAERGL